MDKILHFYYTLNIQSSYYIDFIKFRAYPTVIIHALISYIRIFIELLTACFLLKFKLNEIHPTMTWLYVNCVHVGFVLQYNLFQIIKRLFMLGLKSYN